MIKDENTPDLELDENQDQDVQEENNESEDNQEQNQDDTASQEDVTDWKAEALKYKAILARNKDKPYTKESSKNSDVLDYGAKAFLKSSGIETSEFDFVKEELKQSGFKDLDSLLENDYFKSKLENRRSLQKTQNATIKGKSSNGVATNSVEYWMGKPIEEVPADMRIKVINAKLEKDNKKGVFYNS